MSGKILGIDLGTTNSLVGLVDTGFPVLIPDGEGSRLLPSVVRFSKEGKVTVGAVARRAERAHGDEVVRSIKRLMGRRWQEVADEVGVGRGVMASGDGGNAGVVAGGIWRSPVEVSAEILKELKARAERYYGEKVERAVITVPAYFNDGQRQATKLSGELAGFQVERILNEPTAAALAYGLDRQKQGRYAVFDLGGGTFDITILEQDEGTFRVLSTCGDTQLGGDDLDRALAEWLLGEVRRELGKEAAEAGRAAIWELVEGVKIRLSDEASVRVDLPFLWEGKSASIEVKREWLEERAQEIFGKTRHACRRALSDAKIEAKDLDAVLLVGGQTRMPWVRRWVEEIFGKRPDTSINPDEAVALGATIQAGILEGSLQGMVLLDVTPLSLGIETFGGLMNVIIPRNSSIPCKAGEQFTSAVDGQSGVQVRVLQGERELAKDNWELGVLTVPFAPAPRGVPRVGVQFEIDSNGILKVLGRDLATGQEQILEIHAAIDVSDEKVEAMVEASIENAFEDMAARQWVEAKLSGERTVLMTRKALEILGERASQAERSEAERLMGLVEEALRSEDGRLLKQRIRELDVGTQGLAERLMKG